MGVLNFLRRNFHHCSSTAKEKLYTTLVRPHLDYASASWDPYTSKNIASLERVQRQAARFARNTYGEGTSVTQLLDSLKWNPLKSRREAHRLTSLYKMQHGQLDIDINSYIKPKSNRNRRGHNNQFFINAHSTDVYANSFFPRTIKAWNHLQQSTISQPSSNTFKSALHKDPSLTKN
jgi:hypothetical protein